MVEEVRDRQSMGPRRTVTARLQPLTQVARALRADGSPSSRWEGGRNTTRERHAEARIGESWDREDARLLNKRARCEPEEQAKHAAEQGTSKKHPRQAGDTPTMAKRQELTREAEETCRAILDHKSTKRQESK